MTKKRPRLCLFTTNKLKRVKLINKEGIFILTLLINTIDTFEK